MRDVHDVDLGDLLEHLAGEIGGARGAGRGEIERARFRAREREEFLDVVRRQLRRDGQRRRYRRDLGDAGEILHRIERRRAVDHVGDRMAARREHDGVAVRRRLGDRRRAREARPVLDDHLLLPHFAELVGDDAGLAVGVAAGGERHDDANRLGRKLLRRRRLRERRQHGRRDKTMSDFHDAPLVSLAGRRMPALSRPVMRAGLVIAISVRCPPPPSPW